MGVRPENAGAPHALRRRAASRDCANLPRCSPRWRDNGERGNRATAHFAKANGYG